MYTLNLKHPNSCRIIVGIVTNGYDDFPLVISISVFITDGETLGEARGGLISHRAFHEVRLLWHQTQKHRLGYRLHS